MSIYIKGMEMPTNCFDCPCVEAEFMECAAKEHLSLPKDEYGAALGEVPNWCPLIPVPEHGDLIDRDALMKDGWLNLHKEVMRMGGYAVHELPLTNPSIPVVIPADRR